jgi:uncharacterized protein with GYD domain
MPTYLLLITATQKALESRKDSPARIDAQKKDFEKSGVKVIASYHGMGHYDGVQIVEAPNALSVNKAAIAAESKGYIHIESRRIFTDDEYRQMVA